MKKYSFFLFFAFCPLFLLAQEKDSIPSKGVPFAKIEEAPIFPGCEKLDKPLQKMCFQNQIKRHVEKEYNTKLADKLGLKDGIKRVYVLFKIDHNGDVVGIRARGPHKDLEQEAVRVIQLLPKMIPGKNNGENVEVNYAIPIRLLVKGKKKRKH